MKKEIQTRVLKEAHFIIETQMTIRQIGNFFQVSKSTVHKDLRERLKKIDFILFEKVNKILQNHMEVRHIRGGEKTKRRYLEIR